MKKNSDRFNNWAKPNIVDGKMTKWNWMVQGSKNLELGELTDIGAFTYINSTHGVYIGRNVQIGSHCSVYSVSTIDDKQGKVIIGENTCIGSHSTVMPGIVIGKNCLIGAHTFVNKNIPDNCIAYGVPVKFKKREKDV